MKSISRRRWKARRGRQARGNGRASMKSISRRRWKLVKVSRALHTVTRLDEVHLPKEMEGGCLGPSCSTVTPDLGNWDAQSGLSRYKPPRGKSVSPTST